MPGIYSKNEFDLAGFAVGVVERKNLINKKKVAKNSQIIGIKSNGFHSNGFSLIRKVLKNKKISLKESFPFKSSRTIGEELVLPTKIYVKELLPLIKKNYIDSIAHITGGGIFENVGRALPLKHRAIIDTEGFKIPEIFLWFKKIANISSFEMLNTFNCGLGMILIIDKKNEIKVFEHFEKRKIKFYNIGYVENKENSSKDVTVRKFGEWHSI